MRLSLDNPVHDPRLPGEVPLLNRRFGRLRPSKTQDRDQPADD